MSPSLLAIPRRYSRLTPARRQWLVRLGAWFVLVAALLPNVSYMGHWPIAGADVHLEAGVDPSSVIAEHEAHCHIGPANCGGGESMVGTPFAGEDNGVLSLPGSEMKFDAGHDYHRQDGHAARILQPPRLTSDAHV
jgi:hypothetical protein